MDETFSPDEYLSRLVQSWTGRVLLLGSVLFTTLEFMDYFASAENFKRFIAYRIFVSLLLIILYFLNKLKRNIGYQFGIAAIGTTLCAVTIEIAVLQSGGQHSVYYAAMIILAICSLGFVPFSMPLSIILVGIIYAVYLVPIVLTETILEGLFVSNNAFLISAFVIGLMLRYANQRLIMTELRLRAELSTDKRNLELHSGVLEGRVAETAGALIVSEQKYRALFDNATDGIAVLDPAGNITDVNQQFCKLHGFDRDGILGTNIRLLEKEQVRGENDERLKQVAAGETLLYEAEHFCKDGTSIDLEVSSKAINVGGKVHVQAFYRDITEKKKLQEQVMQSQKMESMGLLAGGMAHDFNNVLTAILGHTEVLRRHIGPDEFALQRIRTVEEAARRAGLMISKLLRFARKETLTLTPTDLNAVVLDTLDLLGRALIEKNIKVQVDTDPAIPLVNGDSIHLQQIITNLVMNAMDAMPRGGELVITTSLRDIGRQTQQAHPFVASGTYCVLSIRDTGSGIHREVIDRIFDPFFTTKSVGKGTGLGLAMVYGLVKSHHGEIRVLSTEGAGSTFEIYLPVINARDKTDQFERPAMQRSGAPERTCVLIVDSEQEVLTRAREMLAAEGYRVYAMDNPGTAEEVFRATRGKIDLLIIDMALPFNNGTELVRYFKTINNSMKVIGVSGDAGGMQDGDRSIDLLVNRPYDGPQLLQTIMNVLGKKESAGANTA